MRVVNIGRKCCGFILNIGCNLISVRSKSATKHQLRNRSVVILLRHICYGISATKSVRSAFATEYLLRNRSIDQTVAMLLWTCYGNLFVAI